MSNLFNFKFQKKSPAPTISAGANIITNDKLILSDEVFDKFRASIYDLCGIYYSENKKYLLEGRISKRIIELDLSSYQEYLTMIRNPVNRDELTSLFDAITINETYFFRANHQFEALENIVIPEIIESKKNKFKKIVRIWSAASSSGEEAYSMAIMIQDRLSKKYPNVEFQILASDINKTVIDNARKGIYKEYAIRNIEKPLLEKYFTKNGNSYILSEKIKSMVKFTKINLYDDSQMRQVSGCDVIFCCNVLIYFDIPSKQKVITHLFDSLNRGGYLFIGYSESLHGISRAFKLIHLHKAMTYKKE